MLPPGCKKGPSSARRWARRETRPDPTAEGEREARDTEARDTEAAFPPHHSRSRGEPLRPGRTRTPELPPAPSPSLGTEGHAVPRGWERGGCSRQGEAVLTPTAAPKPAQLSPGEQKPLTAPRQPLRAPALPPRPGPAPLGPADRDPRPGEPARARRGIFSPQPARTSPTAASPPQR